MTVALELPVDLKISHLNGTRPVMWQ